LRRKDGALIDVSSNAVKLGPDRFLAFHQDVSDRVRDEATLRKLRSAVEQSPASIVITDAEGRIEYVNQAFCRATGYSVEEAHGRNPRMLKSGQTPGEVYKELWERITSGKEWRGELLNR